MKRLIEFIDRLDRWLMIQKVIQEVIWEVIQGEVPAIPRVLSLKLPVHAAFSYLCMRP